MLPKIITFKKSEQYRLEEYQQLFENLDIPCSDVTEIWASIFQDAVIGVDWQALWILSEENCEKYDLLFPTVVIVNVNGFNWSELVANISVIAVQEDIILPSEIDVPVIELHPIKVQDYNENELKSIEDVLDKCRYFFRNLWYPWDAKFNVSMMDWCEKHLQNRLLMQYDMKNGNFDKTIVNYLKLLLMEAQNLNSVANKVFSDDEDEKLSIVKGYIRKKILKTELDLFEKPELRQGMILLKSKSKRLKTSLNKISHKKAKFVWKSGNCKSLMENLQVAQEYLDDDITFDVCASLQEALDASSTDDMILLSPGVHAMNKFRGIENGGVVKGFDAAETAIVPDPSSIPRAILFECFGYIELENLSITKQRGIAIQVFEGILKITNCRIISKNNFTSKGIVVVSGSKIFLENCEVVGFGTGIALQNGTQLTILDSKIINCNEGIKITGDASLTMHGVDIMSCSGFGIKMESSEIDCETPIIGELSLLEENQNCKTNFSSVFFSDNKKGNVILKKWDEDFLDSKFSENNNSTEMICASDSSESESDSDDLKISSDEGL